MAKWMNVNAMAIALSSKAGPFAFRLAIRFENAIDQLDLTGVRTWINPIKTSWKQFIVTQIYNIKRIYFPAESECMCVWECVCHLRAQSFAKILIEWQRIEKVCDATKIDYTHATLKSCNSSSSCNSSRARIEILRACWGHKHGNVSRKGGRAGQGGVGMVWCNQSTRQPATLVSNACVKPPAACCRFASLLQFILIACQAAKRKRETRGRPKERKNSSRQQ